MKGSTEIIPRLRYLIDKEKLENVISLSGRFCMGKCTIYEGVCVKVNDIFYGVKKEEVDDFFYNTVLSYLQK